ncbi:peptidoglycan recognition protein 1-like [Macrosteles quadrilineatus]|uniref:peptidoglycan recognition protein 1-like n=1 Tax=Macrosteles quadrilineatus TaxID=74068 RepID=UPI0023E10C92|nr:peptidoglycan recognition protein 1-like [Macrosteles quadrilineatus]
MQCLEMDGGIQVPLVNRQTWKGLLPKSTEPLCHPITHVRFTYEDLRKYNDDMFQMMPECQKHYMEKMGLPDVPWNFLVGPGGIIVEGRGWHTQPWRPEEKFPELKGKSCLDIAYIGDYADLSTDPTWEMVRSGMYLIMHGLKNNYISSAFQTIPYRDKAGVYQFLSEDSDTPEGHLLRED